MNLIIYNIISTGQLFVDYDFYIFFNLIRIKV